MYMLICAIEILNIIIIVIIIIIICNHAFRVTLAVCYYVMAFSLIIQFLCLAMLNSFQFGAIKMFKNSVHSTK